MSEQIEHGPSLEEHRQYCRQAADACHKVADLVPDDRRGAGDAIADILSLIGEGGTGNVPTMHRQLDLLRGNGDVPLPSLRAVGIVQTAAMCVTHPEHADRWAEEASAAADRLVAEVTARA